MHRLSLKHVVKTLLIIAALQMVIFRESLVHCQPWERLYGGGSMDGATSVWPASDGGYILAGYTTSFTAGGKDIFLVKTDASGNEIWTKSYGGPASETGESVIETRDKAYIITGSTYSCCNGDSDIFLLKTDASGNEIWYKIFGGPCADGASSVVETRDGGFAIAGHKETAGQKDEKAYLLRVDEKGNTLWNRTFSGNGNDRFSDLKETDDGGFILGGTTASSSGNGANGYLVRTDSDGNKIWHSIFDNQNDGIASIVATNDNGFVMAGRTAGEYDNGGIYLMKTDANGNPYWKKIYDKDEYVYSARDVVARQTADSGYIITGGYIYGESYGPFIIKTNFLGSEEWRYTPQIEGTLGKGVVQLSDGGYVIVGEMLHWEPSGDSDVSLFYYHPDDTTTGQAPVVNGTFISSVSETSATLTGSIKSTSETATYHFEYRTSAEKVAYSTPPVTAGDFHNFKIVTADVTWLEPDTEYNYRLVAVNEYGTGRSTELTFKTPKWTFETTDDISTPATGKDGVVYVVSGTSLYAIHPDGDLKWSFEIEKDDFQWNIARPVVGLDNIIYINDESHLHAINPDGTSNWSMPIESISSFAISTDGNTIYVVVEKNCMAIHSNGTGIKWALPLDGWARSPVIAEDGTIYIVEGEKLSAISPEGNRKWIFTSELGYLLTSPAIGHEGRIYVGGEEYPETIFYSLSPDGEVLWSYHPGGIYMTSPPVVDAQNTIYFVDGTDKLQAIFSDGKPGVSIDAYLFDMTFRSPAIERDGTIYVSATFNQIGQVRVINPDGRLKEIFSAGDMYRLSSPVIGPDGTVFVGGQQKLFAITGSLSNQFEINSNSNGANIKFESSSGTVISNCQMIDPPSPDTVPENITFPNGTFSFEINNVSNEPVIMTIVLPEESTPETYYKYGPTPDNPADHWYEFMFDGETGATITNNVITLVFIDGKRGDSDLDDTNKTIVDPGAPAIKTTNNEENDDGGDSCFIQSLI